jgi:hypothetical protein
MAEIRRHAAGRTVYEVHEVVEGPSSLDLGSRHECSDFLDAFDFALEYLEENDPKRVGRVSGLHIVKIRNRLPEIVWTYSHARQAAGEPDLVAHWGFDVTRRWTGPSSIHVQ